MSNGTGGGGVVGCGCVIVIINLLLGGVTFNYCLESFFNFTINFWGAMACGIFIGEFTVPLAIVCWILRACGVPAPFVHPQ